MSDDNKVNLYYPVAYLDESDFKGKELSVLGDIQNTKKTVVMYQASWRHHCNKAKPAFQQFADENLDIFCATVQVDGDTESERNLGKKIKDISVGFRGFPHYGLFIKGKLVDKQLNDRSVQGLIEFSKN